MVILQKPQTTLEVQQASASFGPATLKVTGLAFDQAWAEIAPNFDRDGRQSQLMRLVLAKAILRVATDESRNVEALKNEALQMLAADYRAGAASVMRERASKSIPASNLSPEIGSKATVRARVSKAS
jgi:hypothetical protein